MFGPKKDVFFEKILVIAKHLESSAKYFTQIKGKNGNNLYEISAVMKEFRAKGNTFINQIILELNKSFITPIERDDILQLAMKMDDILNSIEKCTAYYEIFSFKKQDEFVEEFISYIYECTIEITKSMELLSKKKLINMRVHSIMIKEIEVKCETLFRKALKQLFNEKDVLKVIQQKEIYGMFKITAERCREVATTIETIIMRNA